MSQRVKMGKIIGGVVAGFLVAMIVMFVLFTLTWTILGASGSFMPGTWEVSMTWAIATLVVYFLSGWGGGFVCGAIAKSSKAGLILAIILLAFFLLSAMQAFAPATTEARPETVQMVDAMTKARNPMWLALVAPLLIAAGAYLGGKRREESPTGTVQTA